MPTTTLASHVLRGTVKDELDPFTMHEVGVLLLKRGLVIIEENGITTRTLRLTPHSVPFPPQPDEAPSRDNVGEELAGGDGHHDLARYRMSGAEIGTDEGEE
jgi:hypothetical protein